MAAASETDASPAAAILRRSLDRGRVGHAYLFSGDAPIELEALALAFAQVVNCLRPSPGVVERLGACNACSRCQKIAQFNHPDILWVRPESKLRTITIDQIREVMHALNLKPTEAAWKVAILVSADRMNVQAANAFLKTLEEPPARSLLILLSGEPQKLLETIRSRCLRLNVQSSQIGAADSADRQWLARFCADVAAPQKSLLSRYLLLDGLLGRLSDIRASVERDLSARSPLQSHEDIDPDLREQWEDELSAAIEAEYRKRRSDLMELLHWWLRDVWLARNADDPTLWRLPELAEPAKKLAARLNPGKAFDNLKLLERTRRLLETTVQEALALEVGLLKLHL